VSHYRVENCAPVRFHWRPGASEPSNLDSFSAICRTAENAGLDSVEVPGEMAEALALARDMAKETNCIQFRIRCAGSACESGTAWAELRARIILHCSLAEVDLDQAATAIAQYRELGADEIDVEGESAHAAFLAIRQADCLWRRPGRPDQVYADALPVLHFGKDAGLVIAIAGQVKSVPAFAAKGISQFLLEGRLDLAESAEFVRRLKQDLRGG
jgi:hypothetical protein